MSIGNFFPAEVVPTAGEPLRRRIADGPQTVTVQQHCDRILHKTGERNCRDTHRFLHKTWPGFETTSPETYGCGSPTDLLSWTLLLDLSLTCECPRAHGFSPGGLESPQLPTTQFLKIQSTAACVKPKDQKEIQGQNHFLILQTHL